MGIHTGSPPRLSRSTASGTSRRREHFLPDAESSILQLPPFVQGVEEVQRNVTLLHRSKTTIRQPQERNEGRGEKEQDFAEHFVRTARAVEGDNNQVEQTRMICAGRASSVRPVFSTPARPPQAPRNSLPAQNLRESKRRTVALRPTTVV